MTAVIWSDRALDDLEMIEAHIAQDSLRAAKRVAAYIYERAALLDTSPLLGRASVSPDTRELILHRYPYVLVYRLVGEEVRILAVFHQSQDR